MKTRTREIAKVGIFGSTDNPQIVNEKDLLEIVETFVEIKKSPISLNGHWLDASSPRLGNVIAVTYDNVTKTLSAEIEEHETLHDCVDKGYYPDVSIGAKSRASDGKMYLHHLAYLGEEPPAVKDLQKDIKETQELVLNLCDSFDEGKTIELSDSQGKKTECTPSDVLCRVFQALPLPVQPGVLNLSDSGENERTVGNEKTRKMLGNL